MAPHSPGAPTLLSWSAIAYEWIKGDKIDKEFLDKYCVGYDDDTMPESAKGQNKSYKDYIMGTGYDKIEKTPEWRRRLPRFRQARSANLPT